MVFITNSAEETEKIGERLCNALIKANKKKAFISMEGEMGVGKTAFTRGFAAPLGIRSVKSPTYTIVNEYRGTSCVYHFDMYRISDADDLYSIGFDEYTEKDGFCIAEWSENIKDELPEERICVKIERTDSSEFQRKITISDGYEI